MTATHDQLCAIPDRVDDLEAYREHLADRIPRLEAALRDVLTRIATLEGRLPHYTPRRPQPIAHGTDRGYRQHRRRHETPCRECLDAHATYNRTIPSEAPTSPCTASNTTEGSQIPPQPERTPI